jgi:hypothetical protein
MNTNTLKLVAYKTDKGLYFASAEWEYTKLRKAIYNVELANGKPLKKSEYRGDWYFLDGEDTLTSLQTHKHGGYGQTYWELRDSSAVIDGVIPLRIETVDADEVDDDGDFYIGSESKYYTYRGLYQRKREALPLVLVDVPFEVEYKGTIEHTLVENNYKDAKVRLIQTGGWSSAKTTEQSLMSVVTFYELEQLLTPDLVLHNRPCYINSDTTYQIVRNWIKEHIDLKHAHITSDYDFCFTVKKLVSIKPYIERKEIRKSNGRSYASPKLTTRSIETKEVEIFEMCPSKKYNNYTPIDGFKGDNIADLVENMRLFLEELMRVINKPVQECQHCGGLGCTYTKTTNTNER